MVYFDMVYFNAKTFTWNYGLPKTNITDLSKLFPMGH